MIHSGSLRIVVAASLVAGITGAVEFDERGEVRRDPVMHKIWNQRVVSGQEDLFTAQ